MALLIILLERSPELLQQFNSALGSIIAETRSVGLFAELGVLEEQGLVAEASSRLLKRVLPSPRDDENLSKPRPAIVFLRK